MWRDLVAAFVDLDDVISWKEANGALVLRTPPEPAVGARRDNRKALALGKDQIASLAAVAVKVGECANAEEGKLALSTRSSLLDVELLRVARRDAVSWCGWCACTHHQKRERENEKNGGNQSLVGFLVFHFASMVFSIIFLIF